MCRWSLSIAIATGEFVVANLSLMHAGCVGQSMGELHCRTVTVTCHLVKTLCRSCTHAFKERHDRGVLGAVEASERPCRRVRLRGTELHC